MIPITGSRWYRCDFHVHGPKSDDYRNKSDTPEMWIRAAILAGLDCIAITDHNSGEWIDDLKNALERMRQSEKIDLVIFPGVELTIETGWHLLVLFDPSKNRDHVKSFLSESGIPHAQQGRTDVQSKSIDAVLNSIQTHEGICILSHANDKKGLLLHDSGTYKKDLLNNPVINGVELRNIECCSEYATDYHSTDAVRVAEAKKRYDAQLQSLKDYMKTRSPMLASVWFSDNPDSTGHGLSGIGGQSTWIKMSVPDKEGLRLALHDGPMCCNIYDAHKPHPNSFNHPVIKKISIEKAYITGLRAPLNVEFSPWLTTIIGGRGTGKSTVVECLRIGLCREKELEKLGDSSIVYKSFLDFKKVNNKNTKAGALREETKIAIQYTKDANSYEIGWSADAKAIAIQKILSDGTKAAEPGDVSGRFPVSIYSQKQIYEIARNPIALLNIIDQSPEVSYKVWKQEWESKVQEFLTLCSKARELHLLIREKEIAEGALKDLNAKIAVHENGRNKEIRLAWQKVSKQRDELQGIMSDIKLKPTLIQKVVDQLVFPSLDETSWREEGSNKKVREARDKAEREFDAVRTSLSMQLHNIESAICSFEKGIKDSGWEQDFASTKESHDTLVAELKQQGELNAEEYEKLLTGRKSLLDRLTDINKETDKLPAIQTQINALPKSILEMRQILTRKRQEFVSHLASNLRTVKIEIEPYGDSNSFESALRNLLNAPTGYESSLSLDSEHLLSGKEMHEKNIPEIIYSAPLTAREGKIVGIQKLILDIARAEKKDVLIGYFENKIRNQQPETIDKVVSIFPEDRVTVSYKEDPQADKWQSISVGSPGQKTAAILTLLLAHGTEPLVIDQPEDDLENRLIYKLVVEHIKENKNRRQIIIVTHNPNIPVNGDSEAIAVMKPISGGFDLGLLGGLQENKIRKEICEIMEGGEDAFKKRYERILGGQ